MSKKHRQVEGRAPASGDQIDQRVRAAREDAIIRYVYGKRG